MYQLAPLSPTKEPTVTIQRYVMEWCLRGETYFVILTSFVFRILQNLINVHYQNQSIQSLLGSDDIDDDRRADTKSSWDEYLNSSHPIIQTPYLYVARLQHY